MKKFREYFEEDNRVEAYQLDNLITNIFDDRNWNKENVEQYYIQSDYDPNRYSRFKRDVEDDKLVNQHNDMIEGFQELGSNEKFIINKIMKGKPNVTILVGTIGSGKTSTCWFVMKKIEQVRYGKNGVNPIQISIDLKQLPEDIQHSCKDQWFGCF